MNTYWDIFGSIIISSLFMMTIIVFHNSLSQERSMSNLWIITQENAKALSDVIEYDLRKIGYGLSPGQSPFLSADSTQITFCSDFNKDGNIDSIRYHVSDSTQASGTDNPKDLLFYRVVNGQTVRGSALGITSLKFSYYDSTGTVTNTLDEIREIEVEFNVESPITVDRYYPSVFILKKIKPKNIL